MTKSEGTCWLKENVPAQAVTSANPGWGSWAGVGLHTPDGLAYC